MLLASHLTDEALLEELTPIMDNLMEASRDMDFARHTRDFSPRLKSFFTPSHLIEACTKYQQEKGFFTGKRKLVALFRRPDSIAVIWVQHFTKVAGDYVAEAVFIASNGRWLVDHVMVF
jgi:hypothetical protein